MLHPGLLRVMNCDVKFNITYNMKTSDNLNVQKYIYVSYADPDNYLASLCLYDYVICKGIKERELFTIQITSNNIYIDPCNGDHVFFSDFALTEDEFIKHTAKNKTHITFDEYKSICKFKNRIDNRFMYYVRK